MRVEPLAQEQEERQKVVDSRWQRIDTVECAKLKIGGYVGEFIPPCAVLKVPMSSAWCVSK